MSKKIVYQEIESKICIIIWHRDIKWCKGSYFCTIFLFLSFHHSFFCPFHPFSFSICVCVCVCECFDCVMFSISLAVAFVLLRQKRRRGRHKVERIIFSLRWNKIHKSQGPDWNWTVKISSSSSSFFRESITCTIRTFPPTHTHTHTHSLFMC
jgi:hypothetical protein